MAKNSQGQFFASTEQFMENIYQENQPVEHVHFGHLSAVLFVAVLLVGFSWLKNPQLFSIFQKQTVVADNSDVPQYYAYVPPASVEQPLVAGASTQTDGGPMVINEDGSVTSAVDAGSVLGDSTAASATELSLAQIQVTQIPDSPEAFQNYISQSGAIENGFINNSDFEAALSSGDQTQINAQALKLQTIVDNLEKLQVPASFVNLQKLKILQYSDGVLLLNNFTDADNNPQLVGQYLTEFMQSQDDLSNESVALEQKYNIDLGYPQVTTDQASTQDQSSLSTDSQTGINSSLNSSDNTSLDYGQ